MLFISNTFWILANDNDSDANIAAIAETGLGSRKARKGPAGAPVEPDGCRQATDGDGSTVLGAGGTATASRTWRCGLQKHEADDLASDGGRDGSVVFCIHKRCICIYSQKTETYQEIEK
jgi:hypothetical protein